MRWLIPSILRCSSVKRSVRPSSSAIVEQRPLVGDPVEDLADLAVLAGVPLERVVVALGFPRSNVG